MRRKYPDRQCSSAIVGLGPWRGCGRIRRDLAGFGQRNGAAAQSLGRETSPQGLSLSARLRSRGLASAGTSFHATYRLVKQLQIMVSPKIRPREQGRRVRDTGGQEAERARISVGGVVHLRKCLGRAPCKSVQRIDVDDPAQPRIMPREHERSRQPGQRKGGQLAWVSQPAITWPVTRTRSSTAPISQEPLCARVDWMVGHLVVRTKVILASHSL